MTESTVQPTVPLRVAFEVEVTGTPEQVWAAIATAGGLSSWFLPTSVEERQGGRLVTHMGDVDSPATIVVWEPPHRLVYEEAEWAGLVGQEASPVTPLASEFLVEARSGGTCVVTVVSSALGTGADWEAEFLSEMESGWKPFFANLALYLAHFPGQHASTTELASTADGDVADVWSAVRRSAGEGSTVELLGFRGQVHQAGEGALLAKVDGPAPGLLGLHAYRTAPGTVVVVLRTWLFGPDAAGVAQRERDGWQRWLDDVAGGGTPTTLSPQGAAQPA